jgi:hypothetical protein
MELTKRQINYLNKFTEGTWSLNPETGLVDVDGYFDCSDQKLEDFKGVRFGTVTGNFYCENNSLTSLEGAPQKVRGDFACSWNSLTTLEGAPQEVGGKFRCQNNSSLTTLEGAPQRVEGYFYCDRNSLTDLKGAPQKVGRYFDCSYNSLTSLEGAPHEVGGDFYCGGNPIPAKLLRAIWYIMRDKKVPYLIALGIYKKEVKGAIDSRLTEGISEKTLKGASLLGRILS